MVRCTGFATLALLALSLATGCDADPVRLDRPAPFACEADDRCGEAVDVASGADLAEALALAEAWRRESEVSGGCVERTVSGAHVTLAASRCRSAAGRVYDGRIVGENAGLGGRVDRRAGFELRFDDVFVGDEAALTRLDGHVGEDAPDADGRFGARVELRRRGE